METITVLFVIAIMLGVLVVLALGAIGFALFTLAARLGSYPTEQTCSEKARSEHTRSTKAGLEDASLVLVRGIIEAKNQVEYLEKIMGYAASILGEVDDGPNAYKADQPSRFYKIRRK
jgi:uncharacterized membrane protein